MIRIVKRSHPEAFALARTWADEAHITGQTYVQRPYWYEDTMTGRLYHDIFGCIGWPSEVNDKDDGMPGYIGIVGVVKPKTGDRPIKDSVFQLLDEIEHPNIPTLLDELVRLRFEYGYELYPNLLSAFFGDTDRFITILALYNERLVGTGRKDRNILITPPCDFYESKAFDSYVRSLRSSMMPDSVRFYFGKNEILKNRLKEFKRDDPSVQAMGGLVHTLLGQYLWMDSNKENTFVIDEVDKED